MGQLGGLSPGGSIVIGVLVGLVSTSLQAIGLTLQRKSHMLEDEKSPYDLRRPPYKRRRWQVGMSMFVISNIIGSTIQITTLPLPVLSTLQAAGLVFNTIFAALILGEPFTRYSIFGTILVSIGAVMIGIFGAIGEPAHTLDQLLVLLGRRPFILWMAATAVLVAITLLGARMLRLISTPGQTREWIRKYCIPILYTPPLHGHHSPRIKVLRGMMYGSVSGILSAHSLLFAKLAVELIVRTVIDRMNQFNRWQSWIILLTLVVLALTPLYYMHCGLKLCSTSILYPYVFCIYNVIAILDGLIYFHQGSRLSGFHAGLIALGTIILLSGVLCLSWRLEPVTPHPGTVSVGPPPSLTPGLGLLEEQPTLPEYTYYPEDEETTLGERQPLLQTRQLQAQKPRKQQQKPPSPSRRHTRTLTDLSPNIRRNTRTSLETAEIWAELDDSEDNLDLESLTQPSSPILPYSPTIISPHKRHRSTSGISSHFNITRNKYRSSSRNDGNENNNNISINDPSSPSPSPARLNGHGQQVRRALRSTSWTWSSPSRLRRPLFRNRDTNNSGEQRLLSSPLVVNYRDAVIPRDDSSTPAGVGGVYGGVDGAEADTNAGPGGRGNSSEEQRSQDRSQFTSPLR
ncbi:DUF803 domain-containing protein [Histoplasma capsulatum G186AR]|uniref:DUF803 domain-containing protein n=1 Tax=Ajellomyces capsulatus TaxID=5037 RepID=A0A8H7YPH3_AJECA|nr:DUF803 domain-containing protein [Histoplasma capsulatum]QSS74653.1 DUF803 domain-containing protein [Histoplasma capsulatum G186AR]